MRTSICHLVPEKQGSSPYGVNVFVLPTRAPHVAVGGAWFERSCLWTRTARGYVGGCLGHPHRGWWCLGEDKLRLRFEARHSLQEERHWPLERRPTDVGESDAAPSATSITTTNVLFVFFLSFLFFKTKKKFQKL